VLGDPTIKDVARLAGVSVGTVSNVLNRPRRVSPQTRARVEWAIEQLGFRPNKVARALISQRTSTVGMIVPDAANPFFAELLRAVEDVLGEKDYAVIFGNSDNNASKERRYLRALRERRVDGMIAVTATDADADEICSLGEEVPLVIVDRLIAGWEGDCVLGDNRLGMKMAVGHLIALGHRSIALINGDLRLSTARERYRGFLESLAEHSLEPAAVSFGAFTFESGYSQMSAMLQQGTLPSAVCAANDLLALGAIAASVDAGLSVPGQVSIVGYDDIIFARLSSPGLTTVRQNARAMGAEAAHLILERLEGSRSEPRQVVLEPELVVRHSTAPPGG
jgi:LacI family transcriptional regulator